MNMIWNKILNEVLKVYDFDSWDKDGDKAFQENVKEGLSLRFCCAKDFSEILGISKEDADKVITQLQEYVKCGNEWWDEFFSDVTNCCTDSYCVFLFLCAIYVEIKDIFRRFGTNKTWYIAARGLGGYDYPGCTTNPYDYSWFDEPINDNTSECIGEYTARILLNKDIPDNGQFNQNMMDILLPMAEFCEKYNINSGSKVWEIIQTFWEYGLENI